MLVMRDDNFYCLSTDKKPVDGILDGAFLQELNTGARFIWDGTIWVEDLSLVWAANLV
jgi:hypothetical protein